MTHTRTLPETERVVFACLAGANANVKFKKVGVPGPTSSQKLKKASLPFPTDSEVDGPVRSTYTRPLSLILWTSSIPVGLAVRD